MGVEISFKHVVPHFPPTLLFWDTICRKAPATLGVLNIILYYNLCVNFMADQLSVVEGIALLNMQCSQFQCSVVQ